MDLEKLINEVWNNRELLKDETYTDAIRNVIDKIDEGVLRTAEPVHSTSFNKEPEDFWKVNEWV